MVYKHGISLGHLVIYGGKSENREKSGELPGKP